MAMESMSSVRCEVMTPLKSGVPAHLMDLSTVLVVISIMFEIRVFLRHGLLDLQEQEGLELPLKGASFVLNLDVVGHISPL